MMHNTVTSKFNVSTHSLTISIDISVMPNYGVTSQGTVENTTWASCARALAILLDGLENSVPDLTQAIEKSISGMEDSEDGDTDDDGTSDAD
jgi:hypothetical protein